MSPWTIIGWIVLAAIGIPISAIAVKLLLAMWRWIVIYVSYLRTRNAQPAEGQVWAQGDSSLHIKRITDEGRVVINVGGASWSDSPEQWRARVRNRRLRRVR